jgi:hypothetical protein
MLPNSPKEGNLREEELPEDLLLKEPLQDNMTTRAMKGIIEDLLPDKVSLEDHPKEDIKKDLPASILKEKDTIRKDLGSSHKEEDINKGLCNNLREGDIRIDQGNSLKEGEINKDMIEGRHLHNNTDAILGQIIQMIEGEATCNEDLKKNLQDDMTDPLKEDPNNNHDLLDQQMVEIAAPIAEGRSLEILPAACFAVGVEKMNKEDLLPRMLKEEVILRLWTVNINPNPKEEVLLPIGKGRLKDAQGEDLLPLKVRNAKHGTHLKVKVRKRKEPGTDSPVKTAGIPASSSLQTDWVDVPAVGRGSGTAQDPHP